MPVIRASSLLVLFVAIAMLKVSVVESNCWKTWSRCSGWSSSMTGVLWKGCDECCKCRGREGGNCVLTDSSCFLSKKAYSCHCYGTYGTSSCSCYL